MRRHSDCSPPAGGGLSFSPSPCRHASPRAVAPVGSAPPARIVSLLPAATEILDALGAGDRLVAASTDARRSSGLPDAGDPLHPSLEVISRISPELILASPQTELGPPRRAAPEGAAILSLEILTLDDLRDTIGASAVTARTRGASPLTARDPGR